MATFVTMEKPADKEYAVKRSEQIIPYSKLDKDNFLIKNFPTYFFRVWAILVFGYSPYILFKVLKFKVSGWKY